MISNETLAAYENDRPPGANRAVICHAPFLNLNFEQNGNVTACCYNRKFILGSYPRDSVDQIWTGSQARELRAAFLEHREVPTCALCFHQVQSGNFAGALMRNFDHFAHGESYVPALDMPAPLVLEFEISNTCNLECVMCGGHWSSSIRARREHLPPLRSPYDKEFVRQLEPYLPSVVQARFLGGEPFLIRRYYDIWEAFARLNPSAQIAITTNASFLPDRAREAIEGLRADIIVSLDAVTKQTYESIRRNAVFEEVMENVEYLLDYTRRKNHGLTLAVCPMQQNWRELHLLLQFCDERRIGLHFNTVMRPREATIGGLSIPELVGAIEYMESIRPVGTEPWQVRNADQLGSLIHQLREWLEHKRAFEARYSAFASRLRKAADRDFPDREVTQRLGPALDGLALAWQWDAEQDSYEPWELRNLLPPVPMHLWEESPADADLLLAALILSHEAPAQPADDSSELPPSAESIDRFVKWANDSVGDTPALAAWVTQRAATGQGVGLVRGILQLMRAAGTAEEGSALDTTAATRAAWGLFDGTPGPSERERTSAYLRELMAGVAPGLLPDEQVAATREPATAILPIRDLDELRAALRAAYAWRAIIGPDARLLDFRQRVLRAYNAVARLSPDEATAALGGVHVQRVLDFLVATPDNEFDRIVSSLGSRRQQ